MIKQSFQQKFYTTIIVCFFVLCSSNAQNKFSFGTKFGLNLSDLITDESMISPRPTFHFGTEIEYRLNDVWGFQSELVYNRLGNVRRGVNDLGIKFDNTLVLDYINIPVLVNYYVSKGLYVNTGPQIGFLIRAEQEDTIGFDSTRQSVMGRYNFIDLSGVFSIGYLTDWGFNIGIRYQLGFIDVLKENLEYTSQQRHSVLQLYMSLRF